MARPRKDNAEYFSHDADMRNDVRIKALRRKFRHNGYSVWNMLLEYLTDCDNFKFEYSEINIELIASDFDVDVKEFETIINYLLKLDLIQKVDSIISCSTLNKRFDPLVNKRDNNRKKYDNNEFRNPELQNNVVSESEKPQSKVKNSKVKKSIKEGEKKAFVIFYNEYPAYKNGIEKELTALLSHSDYKDALPLLIPALSAQIINNDIQKNAGVFVPQWKSMTKWISERMWENVPKVPKEYHMKPDALELGENEEWDALKGLRRCGRSVIPIDAPKRPSGKHAWNGKQWIVL